MDLNLHAPGLVQAALGSVLLVCCSAAALNASRPRPLPRRRALKTVLATTAANAITPAGIGGTLLTLRVHRKSGLSADEAIAATSLRSLGGASVAIVLSVVLATTGAIPGVPAQAWALVLAVLALMVGLAMLVPRSRRRLIGVARAAGAVTRRPRQAALLLLGCVGVTVAQLLTLHGAVAAVGGQVEWQPLLVTLMGSAAARSALPSPGGVGPIEAALIGGLHATGLGLGTAAAAVLVYRTAGHWLPVAGGLLSARALRRHALL